MRLILLMVMVIWVLIWFFLLLFFKYWWLFVLLWLVRKLVVFSQKIFSGAFFKNSTKPRKISSFPCFRMSLPMLVQKANLLFLNYLILCLHMGADCAVWGDSFSQSWSKEKNSCSIVILRIIWRPFSLFITLYHNMHFSNGGHTLLQCRWESNAYCFWNFKCCVKCRQLLRGHLDRIW